jgi:hypothetical protein
LSILFKRYDSDMNMLCSVVNISASTLKRYIQINELPQEILDMMDGKDDTRLTLNVATWLAKLPPNIVLTDFYDKITSLNNIQNIKQFLSERNTDINE